MKFQFPFPTLQHLASLRIAVHLANAKIGPYRSFPEAAWDERAPTCLQDTELEVIVMQLKISEPLKPMLAVVVTGVFHQLCQWLAGLGRCMDHIGKWKEHFAANYQLMQLVFDVHGCLDVTAVWDHFFISKMATTTEVEPLLELMEVAVFHQQLNHLDTILRKVMDIWDRGTELDGPSYTYSRGGKLRMQYALKKRLSPSTSQLLCLKFHLHVDSAFVDEDGITITFFGLWLSVQAFQQHWRSLNDPWRRTRSDVLDFAWNQPANSMREFLESFSEIECKEGLRTLEPFHRLLENFVVWPFAQHVFLPLLQELRMFLSDYVFLFIAIVKKMPSREFGDYYTDIFLEFWNGINDHEKRALFNSLEDNMACLSPLQRKHPLLLQRLVREIEALALPEEDDDLVELVE